MLRDLNKYILDPKRTIEYFQDQLNCSHAISKELKATLNLENGQFYTLLPENANFKELYILEGGWILPQNPVLEQESKSGKKSSYTWIPTLDQEIANYIFEKIQLNENYLAIFEDVARIPEDFQQEFVLEFGLRYTNEFFYQLNKGNATEELIISAIHEINAQWHLLFLLTEIDGKNKLSKEISLDNIKEFCKNIRLLVLGAYDGEGYVFWEPNNISKIL